MVTMIDQCNNSLLPLIQDGDRLYRLFSDTLNDILNSNSMVICFTTIIKRVPVSQVVDECHYIQMYKYNTK